ncbi:hypothetical protein [Moorena producens]|uniref:hypothetical protein n=1 Tax=Moorena producens TaxID=1155739 RepID=UPI003C7068E7
MEWASGVELASCQFPASGGLSQQGSNRRKIRVSPKVVRYGADYLNPGVEAKNKGKSAPNAPYALLIPDSRLPTPDSRLPVPFPK